MSIGLDFGTTNSSVALARPDGTVSVARFPQRAGFTESYRSLLYLESLREAGRRTIKSWSGPSGIERYLDADEKGRLVQSLKSFLSSRNLRSTEVFGKQFQFEDLVARIISDIRAEAQRQLGIDIRTAVVGRPVRFVGAESTDDDDYAVARLRVALERAGFEQTDFELEPVAAAYHYESTLDHDELILIGDFGGGTTDFSLLRVGPRLRVDKGLAREVLGNEGVGIAGDSFDAKIVRNLVSPALGSGSMLRSNGKLLPVPSWVYFKLERWHHLSFLRSSETLNLLRSVAVQAVDRKKLDALVYLVTHDLGYQLHRAVQSVKITLSQAEQAVFRFTDGDVELEAQVQRAAFEKWIEDELHLIEKHLDALFNRTGANRAAVDRVFLTGGSSFVLAVRRIFEARFGAEKIRTGDEFTSVARGLALKSLENSRNKACIEWSGEDAPH